MGRYTGPKVKLMRREGQELYLKGAKTYTDKHPLKRKPQAPGQHGFRRKRLSDYGQQLREKQKVKRIYGLYEKQFRNYYKDASSQKGVTGDVLLSLIERRLDNVVYRLGLASTRAQARQLVGQGKFLVNDKKVDIPSYSVEEKDKVTFAEGFDASIPDDYEIPQWLKWNSSKKEGNVVSLPQREDIKEIIEEKLIIDYYSR